MHSHGVQSNQFHWTLWHVGQLDVQSYRSHVVSSLVKLPISLRTAAHVLKSPGQAAYLAASKIAALPLPRAPVVYLVQQDFAPYPRALVRDPAAGALPGVQVSLGVVKQLRVVTGITVAASLPAGLILGQVQVQVQASCYAHASSVPLRHTAWAYHRRNSSSSTS